MWNVVNFKKNSLQDGDITPLHDAVRFGHLEVADLLLQAVAKQGQAKLAEMLSLKTSKVIYVCKLYMCEKYLLYQKCVGKKLTWLLFTQLLHIVF